MVRVEAVLCAAACCLAAAACVSADCSAPPAAAVSSGQLTGKWMKTRRGRDIAAFEGIPYAAPPVDQLRFQPPQPAKSWDSILKATQPGPICTQRNLFFGNGKVLVGEEDCLYLNVYTPEGVAHETPLTVMVYIHGGGYTIGSGDLHQPDYLLDHDVILVTVNYRLGPFGFLSTLDEVLPGNNGLKDQVQSLRWVQENIAAFGGNPKSVTIFGESAGAASTHLLTLSPLAKGLFHRAICQSGTALAPWAFGTTAETRLLAAGLAEFVGCPASPSKAFKECLLTKTNREIAAVDLFFLEFLIFPLVVFKPVQERAGSGAFIAAHPRDVVQAGEHASDVPLLLGFNSHEGCTVAVGLHENSSALEEFDARFHSLIPMMLFIRDHPKRLVQSTTEKIRKFYFGENQITRDSVEGTINLFSDSMFSWPTYQVVQHYAKLAKSPVYLYEFAHSSHRSFSEILGGRGTDYGVCHGDDLLYLFPLKEIFYGSKQSKEDVMTSETFIEYFVNFAKSGKPTEDNSWRSATEAVEYLRIGSPGDIRVRTGYAPDRMKLWASLPVQIGSQPDVHDEL